MGKSSGLGKAAGSDGWESKVSKRSKDFSVESSIRERSRSCWPRRLADWLNPTEAWKVHSLVDKVYKLKNLELAWQKVRRNKGAGGIDGESLEDFEMNLSENLKCSSSDLT